MAQEVPQATEPQSVVTQSNSKVKNKKNNKNNKNSKKQKKAKVNTTDEKLINTENKKTNDNPINSNVENNQEHTTHEKRNNLFIWYTNADTLTQEKIRELNDHIATAEKPPDIIAVCEYKPKNYTRDLSPVEYKIDGYAFEHENIDDNGATRGVAIYVSESLVYRRILKTQITKEGTIPPKEAISIEIRLAQNESMLFSLIYRSPNSSADENNQVNNFFREFGNMKNCKHKIIVGDFNRKDIDWDKIYSTSSDDQAFIEAVRDSFLIQHVKEPTRGRNANQPTLLDLFFSTSEQDANLTLDQPLGKSDHALMKIVYQCQPEFLPERIICDFKRADFEKMKEKLTIDWVNYLESGNDVNAMWEKFHYKFKEAERECIPKKIIRAGNKKATHPLDRKTLRTRKKKYHLWKRFMETRDAKIYSEYCKCRNQLRRKTRNAIKVKEREIAKHAKNNPKLFWSYVKSKTKLRPAIPDLWTVKDGVKVQTTNDDEKANVLGAFFSSVFVKEPENEWKLPSNQNPRQGKLSILITEDIVSQKLKNLDPSKSPGPDALHPKTLEKVADEITKPLYMIYTTSLRTGKLPDAWKMANITAIYKNKGKKDEAENYRPVSLTSIACKMMESIIRDSVMLYLKENEILSDKQFGFLGGRSTTLQLLKVMEELANVIENKNVADIIYCDFRKAFDTVPHKRLMNVLQYYGIDGCILEWIKDFLCNRKQRVSVNGSPSELFDVTSGVPQGSVLGPLLFVLYINVMIEEAGDANLFLYADDVKLYQEIKDYTDTRLLQENLDKLHSWTDDSLLRFHPDKCEVMRIRPRNKNVDVEQNYKIGNETLRNVSEVKDLGIVFRDDLSFAEHINKKVNKANSLAGILRRSFVHLDKTTFKQLFVSIVRPHLEYGAPIWNPHQKNLITVIENVQRRATRAIPGMEGKSYKERLESLQLPTLQFRRYRGDMIETYKIIHGIYDESVTKGFFTNKSGKIDYELRYHNLAVTKERCDKDVKRFAFKNRVVNQWNHLPAHVVSANSLNEFKNRLDEMWSGDVMYDHECDIYAMTSSARNRFKTTTRS